MLPATEDCSAAAAGALLPAGKCLQLHSAHVPQHPSCFAGSCCTLQHALAPKGLTNIDEHRCGPYTATQPTWHSLVCNLGLRRCTPEMLMCVRATAGDNFGHSSGSTLLLDAPCYKFWPEALLWAAMEGSISTMFAVSPLVSLAPHTELLLRKLQLQTTRFLQLDMYLPTMQTAQSPAATLGTGPHALPCALDSVSWCMADG